MYKAPYFRTDGQTGGEVDLPGGLFDGVVNDAVLHQAVKVYLANQRQGTAAAKNRSAVAGGSRKPWRQKGTGRARQGTTRAPHWAGGGRAFPPQPHGWRQKLPRRSRALAKRSALNARAEAGRVVVVEAFDFERPRTSQLVRYLEAIGAEGKVLILTNGVKETVYLSGRNLPTVAVLPFGDESTYDILWATTVVIERDALAEVPDALEAGETSGRRAIGEEEEAEVVVVSSKTERRQKPEAPAGEAAVEEATAAEAGGGADIALPKVAELANVLAGMEDAAQVEAMQARDQRKTAQSLYEARLAELRGETQEDS